MRYSGFWFLKRRVGKLSRRTGNSRSADLRKNERTPFQMAPRSAKWFEFDREKVGKLFARLVIFQDGKDCVGGSIRKGWKAGRNFEYQSFFVIYDENEEVIDNVKCSREISSIEHAQSDFRVEYLAMNVSFLRRERLPPKVRKLRSFRYPRE